MSEVAILGMVGAVAGKQYIRRRLVYVSGSRSFTVQKRGKLIFRCLGAGGGGAAVRHSTTAAATGGNAGTVGVTKPIPVKQGDTFVITIPAGGAGVRPNNDGQTGGTLTITGPGVNVSVPGGTGGKQSTDGSAVTNDANGTPTGLDWYALSARNTAQKGKFSGGAAPALLLGKPSYPSIAASTPVGAGIGCSNNGDTPGGYNHPGGPGDSPNTTLFGVTRGGTAGVVPTDLYSACVLFVPCNGEGYVAVDSSKPSLQTQPGAGFGGNHQYTQGKEAESGGFGGGGGGASGKATKAGDGGRGAGGGCACPENDATSGKGGDGFVTVEIFEEEF
jgi:hypothetical protein